MNIVNVKRLLVAYHLDIRVTLTYYFFYERMVKIYRFNIFPKLSILMFGHSNTDFVKWVNPSNFQHYLVRLLFLLLIIIPIQARKSYLIIQKRGCTISLRSEPERSVTNWENIPMWEIYRIWNNINNIYNSTHNSRCTWNRFPNSEIVTE